MLSQQTLIEVKVTHTSNTVNTSTVTVLGGEDARRMFMNVSRKWKQKNWMPSGMENNNENDNDDDSNNGM